MKLLKGNETAYISALCRTLLFFTAGHTFLHAPVMVTGPHIIEP